MASLSTVIQGLLVAQLPEYEISNDAIGYLSDYSGKLLLQLINEAVLLVQNTRKSVSEVEVKEAINKVFPKTWASLIIGQASVQLKSTQNEEKDALKQEISDFELIEDDHINSTPEVENRAAGNLFLSAEFIKSFLPASIASRVDSEGCVYLSASLESVLSALIQQSRVTLNSGKEDPMVITKNALVETIQLDEQLALLSKGLSLYPTSGEDADFEPVEEELEEESQLVAQESQRVEEELQRVEEEKAEAVDEATESDTQPTEEEAEPKADTVVQTSEEPTTTSIPPVVVESNIEPESPIVPEILPETSVVPDILPETSVVPDILPETSVESDMLPEASIAENVDVVGSETEENETPYLFSDAPSDIATVRKPVFALYGRCCPYFDITTFAIHMLSSIMELFIRHLISETRAIYHTQRARPLKQHAREALRRLSSFQSQILDEIERPAGGNLFEECVSNSVNVVPKRSEWEPELEIYIADMVLYVASRLLFVASAHARVAGKWLISSDNIASASLNIFSSSAPISQLVNQLTSQKSNSISGEGPLLTPPPTPRIRAAEMIYLTSIIKETPLQLDNQLLVVFMFLVTLSIHTLCCVR